jgi:hypothetical protein
MRRRSSTGEVHRRVASARKFLPFSFPSHFLISSSAACLWLLWTAKKEGWVGRVGGGQKRGGGGSGLASF